MLFLKRLGSVGTGPWQCEPHQPEDVPSAQWSCWSTSPLGEPHSLSLPTLTPHLTCGLQLFLNDQRRNSPGGSGCQEREASGKSHHGQPHPSVSTGQLSPPPVLIPFRARQLMCPATSLHRLALKSSQGREELQQGATQLSQAQCKSRGKGGMSHNIQPSASTLAPDQTLCSDYI